jgi:GT2 family glycosyltransferase
LASVELLDDQQLRHNVAHDAAGNSMQVVGMKFSIITCTLNSEPFIADSIASVRDQQYPHVEHIFVDGGSTDGTLERIKALGGDIKILEDIRGGIAKAMNEGARVATGDIVAHMHSDDIYLGTDALAKVAQAFSERDAPWLFGRCMSIVDGALHENDFKTKTYSWKTLLRRNIIPHAATFYKRDAFHRLNGFDQRYRCAMDYDLWLRLGRLGDPIQLSDYLAAFRFHPGSLSSANALMCHNEGLKVRIKHTGADPVLLAEHIARHTVRTYRLLKTPKSRGGCHT